MLKKNLYPVSTRHCFDVVTTLLQRRNDDVLTGHLHKNNYNKNIRIPIIKYSPCQIAYDIRRSNKRINLRRNISLGQNIR